MARYSSPVRSTSRRTNPSTEASGGISTPGDGDDEAPAPTAARICRTSSRKVGRSGPTASMTVVERVGAGGDGERGQVVDVDRPDPVVAPAAYGEHREVAEQPGDVVEQHPVAAEQDGRPQHRVGHADLGQRALDLGLPAEVAVRGRDARMRDGHVDDPLDARPARRVEERAQVGHGPVVIGCAVGEADPVGVVERGRALERGGQAEHVVEVERADVQARAARARAPDVPSACVPAVPTAPDRGRWRRPNS